MKQLFKILLAACIIALAAFTMAVSCEKNSGGGNNNSGSGNNGSGNNGGNGNSSQPPPPSIAFTNFVADTAKLVNDNEIKLNGTKFPAEFGLSDATVLAVDVFRNQFTTTNKFKRVFDVIITGGATTDATGGLVIVDVGSRNNIGSFSMPTDNASIGSGSGIAGLVKSTGATDLQPLGHSIYAAFLDPTTPGNADQAKSGNAPFAFTKDSAIQPFVICRTTLTNITQTKTVGGNSSLDVRPSATLAGGQKASCYIGGKGGVFTGTVASTWLMTLSSNTFKKSFDIAIAAVRTDGKTIADLMPGNNETEKVAVFNNGLSTDEMTALAAANPSAFRKVKLTMVDNGGF